MTELLTNTAILYGKHSMKKGYKTALSHTCAVYNNTTMQDKCQARFPEFFTSFYENFLNFTQKQQFLPPMIIVLQKSVE